jgi:nitroimidazol reductase NimA-like FMN-containing flavoprotein (pyridoxamine 5'-phosphate oxidase superfamily)
MTSHAQTDGTFRTIPEKECLELLTTTAVGRVAYMTAEGLQLIPLNFAVIDAEIYFRTATDSVLDGLAQGNDEVVFGVDHHSQLYRDGWNVTVKGATTRVSDPDLYEQVMSCSRLHPWAGGTRGVVIHLSRRHVDGRRVHGS